MADLFDGYPLGQQWDEMFGGPGTSAVGVRRPVRLAAAHRRRGAGRPRRPAEPDLPRRRRHVRPRRRGAAVPAGHRAAGHRRRGVGGHRAGRRPAGARARGVPRRRLRRRPVLRRPGRAAQRRHDQRALPPAGARAGAAERRARARVGHRPGPRRGRRLPRARGQPALAVGRQLRHHQPRRDEPGAARAVRRPPHPAGRRLPEQAAGRAQGLRAVERGRTDGRRPHPRRLQLRLLRARAAGPPDGRRTGRGPRPGLRRQPGQHADDGRAAAGRRHLPAHRRRVPRPGALPPRLRDRLRRRAQRRPRRPGRSSPTPWATASPTTSCSSPGCRT